MSDQNPHPGIYVTVKIPCIPDANWCAGYQKAFFNPLTPLQAMWPALS